MNHPSRRASTGRVVVRGTNLTRSFAGRTVLEDVSLALEEGEILGIIGPGGGGKTVLVKMLCGLLVPDDGNVEIFGQDLFRLSGIELQALRRRYGLLFQNYALFDFMNVGDNVAFPMRQAGGWTEDEIQARVQDRLTEVGLPNVRHLFANELSGGMKKRVALARSAVTDPEILFFDDPTAGLDPVTSSKIFALVRSTQQHRGSSCVVISHDIDRMSVICDRYLLIYEGRVHFTGTHTDARESRDSVVREFFHGHGTAGRSQPGVR